MNLVNQVANWYTEHTVVIVIIIVFFTVIVLEFLYLKSLKKDNNRYKKHLTKWYNDNIQEIIDSVALAVYEEMQKIIIPDDEPLTRKLLKEIHETFGKNSAYRFIKKNLDLENGGMDYAQIISNLISKKCISKHCRVDNDDLRKNLAAIKKSLGIISKIGETLKDMQFKPKIVLTNEGIDSLMSNIAKKDCSNTQGFYKLAMKEVANIRKYRSLLRQ